MITNRGVTVGPGSAARLPDYYAPAPSGSDDTAALATLLQSGRRIWLQDGTYQLSTLALTGINGCQICGAGQGATKIEVTGAGLSATFSDLTEAVECGLSDLTVYPSAQKTAGALFYLDKGSGSCEHNRFERMIISSAYRAFQLNACTLTHIEDIYVEDTNTAWGWDSIIDLSAAATSTSAVRIKGGTAAGMTNGVLYAAGAGIDTFHASDWDLVSQGSSSMRGVNISNGQWYQFHDCSLECGSAQTAVNVTGGDRIHLVNPHLIGSTPISISGGTGFQCLGGEIISTRNNGVAISGGTDASFYGLDISDVGYIGGGGSGYNGYSISANVSNFTIIGGVVGRQVLGTTTIANAVVVASGTSDHYVIQGIRAANYTAASPAISDGGTGTNKTVSGNIG